MANFNGKEVPANLEMNKILGKMNEGMGPARSARFVVNIKPCPAIFNGGVGRLDSRRQNSIRGVTSTFGDLIYLCEVAEFPGRTFMNSDIRYYGPSVKFPFQTVYEDVNFTFLCRINSKERELFDTWQEQINPISTFDFNYKKDYATEIDIFQLGERHDAKYVITLLEAYPIQISPQPVTWADDNFQRLAVTFTYTKWGRNLIDYNFGENTANT
jgi:hypothetical protein